MAESIAMPAFLPESLRGYLEAASNEALFESLAAKPVDLVAFFSHATEDETWCEQHLSFIQLSLEWFENRSLQDALQIESIHSIADAIVEHQRVLEPLVVRGLSLQLADRAIQTSALLMIACSDYFHALIRTYCPDQEKPHLEFSVTENFFLPFQEYILTGGVEELWQELPDRLYEIMRQARSWDLEELALLCEEVLKRYIDRSNVFQILLDAHRNQWPCLKNAAIDLINTMDLGFKLLRSPLSELSCQLLSYRPHTLESYARIQAEVTRLHFGGALAKEPEFLQVLGSTPKLMALDLSDVDSFSANFGYLPPSITELVLNSCQWLSGEYLRRIFSAAPAITHLEVMSNGKLDMSCWAALQQLDQLRALSAARCNINDDDFKVILAAAKRLEEININECTELSGFAFTELARTAPDLVHILASKTEINDGSLAEIALHCKRLTKLDVSRSPHIKDKGIRELVQGCPTLRTLVITGCDVSKNTIKESKTIRPLLTII